MLPTERSKAEEIAASDPKYVLLQQFKNPANPGIHATTTGPEIWQDTDGEIVILVSGAAVAAAVRWANKSESEGKTIVVILPDSGERYLSSALFEGVFDSAGLAA